MLYPAELRGHSGGVYITAVRQRQKKMQGKGGKRVMAVRGLWIFLMIGFWLLPSGGGAAGLSSVRALEADGTLVLEDGQRVRLAGVYPADSAAGSGRSMLEGLLAGHRVRLETPLYRDRHGRTVAHLRRDDGLWLQKELVARGWARVYLVAESGPDDVALLEAEDEARRNRRGGWEKRWAIVRAEDLKRPREEPMIVEGTVAEAGTWKGTVYLNFGIDRRTSFTAVVPRETVRRFKKEGIDPLTFKGQAVRVRGWLSWKARPEITLNHPAQIRRVESAE